MLIYYNVQKTNSCINMPSSQTFRSYLIYCLRIDLPFKRYTHLMTDDKIQSPHDKMLEPVTVEQPSSLTLSVSKLYSDEIPFFSP
jgi:hypothetical protein